MSAFTDRLESLFEHEIRAEREKHPLWPHDDISETIEWRMERLAEAIFESFEHPKKSTHE